MPSVFWLFCFRPITVYAGSVLIHTANYQPQLATRRRIVARAEDHFMFSWRAGDPGQDGTMTSHRQGPQWRIDLTVASRIWWLSLP
ncbi:hypothetical protein BGZ63DRAFT_250821 [Mariannaea sp. PMI_226]|nr:hypothetical protein BGZ63DRAFT_250821 [Mariannaea sp. PMI_226]